MSGFLFRRKGSIYSRFSLYLSALTLTLIFSGFSSCRKGSVSSSGQGGVANEIKEIKVTPETLSLSAGREDVLKATATLGDGTTKDVTEDAEWSVDGLASVASVSTAKGSKGKVTGLAEGSVTIQAKIGSIAGESSVGISAPSLSSIVVSAADSTTVASGLFVQFKATGTYMFY